MEFINNYITKVTDLMWSRIEPRIVQAAEEGYKRGVAYGYVAGHEDGYNSGTEDTIRRIATVYDAVRAKAREDLFAEEGAIDLEEIGADEFRGLVEMDGVVDDLEAV